MENNVIQSANFVPGVSGFRINLKTGAIEINGGNLAVGSLSSDPQMITVTAGEWSECDVPAGAKARLAFLLEQIDKVPAEYRADAEFSTEDISFDRDGSDICTTLTYRRLETDQEAAERVARQAGSGVAINADGMTVIANGKVIIRLPHVKNDEQPAELPHRGDESEGALRDALTDWKPGGTALLFQSLVNADKFAVTMARNPSGHYVCTGIGLGIDPTLGETKDGQTEMERAIEKGDVTETLSLIAGQIAKTADPAETVRQANREVVRPGGLLHRR